MKRSELKQLIREAIEEAKPIKKGKTKFVVFDRARGENASEYFDTEEEAKAALAKINKEDPTHGDYIIDDVIKEDKPAEMTEAKKEGVHLSDDVEDEVGSFYIVEKPGTKSTVEDIVVECSDIAYFANQVRGGLKLEDIKGVFVKETKAKKLANKLIKERDDKREEVKKAAEAYKKMKDETLAKVQEYMKNKKDTKAVVDELKDVTKD